MNVFLYMSLLYGIRLFIHTRQLVQTKGRLLDCDGDADDLLPSSRVRLLAVIYIHFITAN